MYDIVTIGELLVDILTEDVNQPLNRPGRLLGPYPSGAPLGTIDQAAKLGAKTAVFAKAGKDDFGELTTGRLRDDGVDVSYIKTTSTNSTGTAFCTYYSDGSRKFIFHFSKAACGELSPDDIDLSVIKNSRYLHICGCTVTASDSLCAAIMKAVDYASENGVKISFDPNIRPELLNEDSERNIRRIIEKSDILLTGKSEILSFYDDAKAAAESLIAKKGDRIVVIKDSFRGTAIYSKNKSFSINGFKVKEVDPTGAGDSFSGAFLASLCAGLSLEEAAVRAAAAGALAVTALGPMEGNASLKELQSFIEKQDGIKIVPVDL